MSEEEEIQAIAETLDAFPAQRGASKGSKVPVPLESKFPWAKTLHARGVRVHAELATEFSIPGNQPGMGRFNTPQWVSREEYDKHVAGESGSAGDDSSRQLMEMLLEVLDPAMAAQIKGLDAAGREQFLSELKPQVPDAMDKFMEVRAAIGVPEPTEEPAKKKAAKKPAKRAPKKS